MSRNPNGEPHISIINFGTYYCSLWRWDDDDHWKFLNNKTGSRRIFVSATLARSETLRIKMRSAGREPETADADTEITAWRAEKTKRDEELHRRVFGDAKPKIVFCNGRVVQVEHKARARA